MAITSKIYKRPNSAADLYAFNKVCRTAHLDNLQTIVSTTPAVASVLPASQTYTTGDVYAEDIICGGTTKNIGKMVGILMSDTVENGEEAAYVVQGGPFLMKSAAAQTWNPGKEVWWKTSDGLIYSADPGGGTGIECGYVVTNPEGDHTETDPANMPTATYVWVVLNQIVS